MGEVTEKGGEWRIKTSTILKSMELKFKVGEKFDETTPDGRMVDSIVTVEGNKLICVQTAKKEGQKSTRSIREFNEDGCTLTIEVTGTDVVSTQVFKRKTHTNCIFGWNHRTAILFLVPCFWMISLSRLRSH